MIPQLCEPPKARMVFTNTKVRLSDFQSLNWSDIGKQRMAFSGADSVGMEYTAIGIVGIRALTRGWWRCCFSG
jgi:hypothetical protein